MFEYLKSLRGSLREKGSIDSATVQKFFNTTQNLMFDDNAAELEQRAVMDIISNIEERRVLDLGCGDGRYSDVIEDYEYYQGVDFSASFIGACGMRAEKNFICSDVSEYSTEHKFNIVLIIGVITYLEDEKIQKMSKNVYDMLLDGGVVILRSVTLKGEGLQKLYYDSWSWNWLRRLFKPRYQIIRRSKAYEVSLFDEFRLQSVVDIDGTSYTLYTLVKE